MRQLDPHQQLVASHRTGAAVCFAVPGAGKTTTAVALVVGLVADGITPSEIVSITFTREATETTRQRLKRELGAELGAQVVVRTFHSLAKWLVDQAAVAMGWPPRTLVDDHRLAALWHEVVLRPRSAETPEGLGMAGVDITDLIGRVDVLRARGFGPDDAPDLELFERKVWRAVDVAKTRKSVCDFYDLITLATEALNHREVGPRLRQRITAVIIDEVQDLNYAQLQFAKALGGDVVMAVGDPCQSIYSFAGSSPQWCMEFDTHWPNARTYHMPQSYRCPVRVLDAARGLLAAMTTDVPRELQGVNPNRGAVHAMSFDTEVDEAEWVVKQIERVVAAHGPGSAAVLARVNRDLEPIAMGLAEAGVRFSADTVSFWDLPEISAAVDAMTLVVDPERTDAAARLACFPGKGDKAIAAVLQLINAKGHTPPSCYAALMDSKAHMINYNALLAPVLALDDTMAPDEFMDWFRNLHPEQRLHQDSATRARDTLATLSAIAARATSIEGLLGTIEGRRMMAANNDAREGVRLMSAHKSKGTEFEFVFILGVEEERFPHRDSTIDPDLLDEERRLLYVATTRAVHTLVYCIAASRDGRAAVPSRFIGEVADKCVLLPVDQLRIDTAGIVT